MLKVVQISLTGIIFWTSILCSGTEISGGIFLSRARMSSVRLVYCLTTIPSRLGNLPRVLDSALAQTRLPDQIYLTIPARTRKGDPYPDLAPLYDFLKTHIRGFLVTILRPAVDHGPIMKMLAVLGVETNPDTALLIGDDDRMLAPWVFETFLSYYLQYPGSALSCSGMIYGKWPAILEVVTSEDSAEVREVDWLQGTDGILIPRKYLFRERLLDYSQVPLELQKTFQQNDDHWLAYQLHKQGVSLRVISSKTCFSPLPLEPISGSSLFTGGNMGISTRKGFYGEVLSLCGYLKSIGYYRRPASLLNSLSLTVILFLGSLLSFLKGTVPAGTLLVLTGASLERFLRKLRR